MQKRARTYKTAFNDRGRGIRLRIKLAHLLLSAFFILVTACPALAAEATLKDDAYHYTPNGINDGLFTEWWYFNGRDNDTQFLFSYFLIDPENITGMRKIWLLAIAMEDIPVVGLYQGQDFEANSTAPYVSLGNNTMVALNSSTYRIEGDVKDFIFSMPMSWNLTYTADANPWFVASDQRPVGHIDGDWMNYLIYMPSARVEGTMTLRGLTRNVSAVGYHDHNWGRWAFNDPRWNWASLSRPEDNFSLIAFDTLEHEGDVSLGIMRNGSIIEFNDSQVKVSYLDFDLENYWSARTYPTAYRMEADNGEYQLDLDVDVLKTVALPIQYPRPQPDYFIFEQVARFNGTLRSGDNVLYQFQEIGFVENTTHKLHPLVGRLKSSDPRNATITAINERTGQTKITRPGSNGLFSIDSDFADYLAYLASDEANGIMPWVEEGDSIILEAADISGAKNSTTITINLSKDRQSIGILDIG
jgi:predicted secreted hydrolase